MSITTTEDVSTEALRLARDMRLDRRATARLIQGYWRLSFFLTRMIERFSTQRLPARATGVVLNFGCGNKFYGGAINSDLFAPHRWLFGRRQPDLYWSGSSALPRLEARFDGIVCEHVIEHLFPSQVATLFANFHALLRPGAALVVSFPDVRRVLAGGLCQGYRSSTVSLNALVYRHGHCFMYDTDLVSELLLQAGFERVAARRFDDLPLRDFLSTGREPESSYVVAHVRV